jgi:hypothetical protein
VKLFGFVAAVVVFLFALVLLTGGHGPGRHGMGSGVMRAVVGS